MQCPLTFVKKEITKSNKLKEWQVTQLPSTPNRTNKKKVQEAPTKSETKTTLQTDYTQSTNTPPAC